MKLTVTSLKHELRDDSVEWRLGVSESLLSSAESSEVGGRLWNYLVIELELDSSNLGAIGRNFEKDV